MDAFLVFILVCGLFAAVIWIFYAINKTPPNVIKSNSVVKRCIVLPVGLGGSGKTSLARHLSGNPEADPSKRTDGFYIYESVNETRTYQNIGKNFTYERYIIDYTGQNPSLLVAEFARLSNFESNSVVRIGTVNCVIFVIDLVRPPKNPGDTVPKRDFADGERVKRQVDEWSENAIALFFGLLARETLKYVCIFLNKADLLTEPDARDEALTQISALRERIQERQALNDFEFEVIVGSIDKGDGLNQLRQNLDKHSIEVG